MDQIRGNDRQRRENSILVELVTDQRLGNDAIDLITLKITGNRPEVAHPGANGARSSVVVAENCWSHGQFAAVCRATASRSHKQRPEANGPIRTEVGREESHWADI